MFTRSKKTIWVPSEEQAEENLLFKEARRFILRRLTKDLNVDVSTISNGEKGKLALIPSPQQGKCFTLFD